MTFQYCVSHNGIEVFTCPSCENVKLLQPGTVLIGSDVVFRPPIPPQVMQHWLSESERQREHGF